MDGIATRLNHICSWYMSYQWEMEALGRDSYSKVVGEEEFLYLHPYPHHIGRLLLNLERSRARGCVSSLSNFERQTTGGSRARYVWSSFLWECLCRCSIILSKRHYGPKGTSAMCLYDQNLRMPQGILCTLKPVLNLHRISESNCVG